jgi:hypothetical protein
MEVAAANCFSGSNQKFSKNAGSVRKTTLWLRRSERDQGRDGMAGVIVRFQTSLQEFVPHRTTNNKMAQAKAFPTVVIAVSGELSHSFARRLDARKILVIEARHVDDLLNIVIAHSRPIHALLIDDVIGDHDLCRILARYRSKMAIVKVASGMTEDTYEAALSELTAALISSK